MAYELGDAPRGTRGGTGYEEEVLDLIDKGRDVNRPGIMGREIIDGDDVQIVAGPKTNATTLGHSFADELLDAAPGTPKKDEKKPKSSSTGADASDVAAVALGVPLAVAAGYGIYKAGSALTADSGPSKPWLYKLSPGYWAKSAREKKFIRATKNASVEDVDKARELSEAEAAYNATQKVRSKESKIQKFEKDIDNPNAVAEAAPAPAAAAAPAGGGDVVGENMNKDAAILTALKKAGVPITANSYLGPDELARATKIVAQISGPENAKSWLTSFMARQAISYGAPDGSVYEIQNGRPTLVAPSAPSDVSMRTNATDDTGKNMRKNRRGTSSTGYFRSPWEKGLMDRTAHSLAMSTAMPTTGVRGAHLMGGRQSPWEKGLMDRTAHSLAMSTEMPTTGVRGDQYEEAMGGRQSPWEKGLMDRTAHSLAMSTEMPTTGMRGGPPASPWERSLGYRTVRNLAMSTSMPTTGVRGAHLMGAAGPSPQEAQVLGQIVGTHGDTIVAIVNAKNLGAKKTWSSKDIDTVAAGLLQKMMIDTGGRKPTASDANIARAAVRFWLANAGGTVVGIFVGGDDVGDFWSGLKTVALSPITVPYWLGKKTVQGVKAVGHKIFGGGSGPSPLQRQQALLAAAAKRKAAAELRIQAAEQRQEAALAEKGAASDAADQQAAALDAEAAAQAAEGVAIEAEATKDVPYTPEALSGWTVVGGCPPSMVGKAALAAATDTPVGRRLRIGAFIGRAMKKHPGIRHHVATIVGQAKAGNPKAKHQVATIKAGIIADKQKLNAVKTNAMVTRAVATHHKRKLLAIGVSPIGLFSRIKVPTSSARPWSPFTFGADTAAAKGKGKGGKSASNIPPAIPGVPPDVLVALTASANTFGVPPMVAASVIAAAKSGDKNAIKELNDAGRVYKAAQKGDPIAKKQLASVATDMKSGYGPAAQKAAVMSAAIGMQKGTKNFTKRKANEHAKTQRAVAAVTAQPMPYALSPCEPVWKCPISFGRTLWS